MLMLLPLSDIDILRLLPVIVANLKSATVRLERLGVTGKQREYPVGLGIRGEWF